MKTQPSNAMENGLTSQLMNSVTPMPFLCCSTSAMAPKSIFMSMGMIMSQISTATGRLTSATLTPPIAWKTPGASLPSRMPATMQASTHQLRLRSKPLILALSAVAALDVMD